MVCYYPMKGYRSRSVGPTGKRRWVRNVRDGFEDMPLTIPCGQCVGCRLERSRQWAVRCVHEASLYSSNCFLTLTYNDDWLPPGRSLVLSDFQKFMKRFRKRFGGKIRFYHCGEYGEQYGRPHYHALIFNFDFEDKFLWQVTKAGEKIYRSPELEKLWPFGHSSIGEVTWKSAAYVARYVMKKRFGKEEDVRDWYQYVDEDGVIHDRVPEYTTMSRRPGIGKGWFERFSGDVYPDDFVVLNGKKFRPPRAYDCYYEIDDKSGFKAVRARRKKNGKKHEANNTPARLKVREQVQQARLKRLKREVE